MESPTPKAVYWARKRSGNAKAKGLNVRYSDLIDLVAMPLWGVYRCFKQRILDGDAQRRGYSTHYECGVSRLGIKPLRNVRTRLVNDHRYIVALRD